MYSAWPLALGFLFANLRNVLLLDIHATALFYMEGTHQITYGCLLQVLGGLDSLYVDRMKIAQDKAVISKE